MNNPSPLWELTMTRVRSFLREPEALFWTFGFPLLMAVGLGVAFRGEGTAAARISIERGSVGERFLGALQASPEITPRLLTPAEAERALRQGEVALVVSGADGLTYRYDPARSESQAARLLTDRTVQAAAGGTQPVRVTEDRERVPGARYIDWVIPGLIGLNLLSTGMWGLGFNIVQMRQKKQLKRLIATPMRRRDFLLSQVLARLVFILLEVPPLVLFAWLAFGVRVEGSLLALSGIVLLGAIAFSGLGLLSAARARTIEGVSGILNLVMLPMFVLSGVFFAASRYPDAMQPFIQALPLTALNDALREVYSGATSLAGLGTEMLILLAWTVGSFVLALRAFRWQ
jgi:ABC-type multidrug transport system permease subunit